MISFMVALLPMLVQSMMVLLLSPLFWLVVLLVAMQYNRMAKTKEHLFGSKGSSVLQTLSAAIFVGLAGGFVGAFLMVFSGITITGIGIGYLWGIAILLLLVSPRFLCFSYAGSILALSYLLFGWPQIEVAHLMALVAILHLVESFLIYFTGHREALPIYTTHENGQTVGAFTLQKFWPIPIVALMLVSGVPVGESIATPDWWPLIKSAVPIDEGNQFYIMLPVVAALGYADIAISQTPRQKSRQTAMLLGLYSILLFLLALLASHYPFLAILPALFAALGHELTIYLGKKNQLQGVPLYGKAEAGLRVLDVTEDSPAAGMGITSGDVLLNVNGVPVESRHQLLWLLRERGLYLDVEFLHARTDQLDRQGIWLRHEESFGVIPVPEPTDPPQVSMSSKGVLFRWIDSIKNRKTQGKPPGDGE